MKQESFDKAVQSTGNSGQGAEAKKASAIVFNGIEYASADEMPTYVRNLYEQEQGKASSEVPGENGQRGRTPKSLEPEPAVSARSVAGAIVLALLALLLYYLVR